MKRLVYVAGPYTAPDPVLNVRRAIFVADQLVEAGFAVIVPHLTMLWHMVSPQDPDTWYARDLDVLEHCDLLVRFPGKSKGADQEAKFAQAHDIPTLFLADDAISSNDVALAERLTGGL